MEKKFLWRLFLIFTLGLNVFNAAEILRDLLHPPPLEPVKKTDEVKPEPPTWNTDNNDWDFNKTSDKETTINA